MIFKKKHTQKDSDSWSFEELYNLIMLDIEPELMTDMIPALDDIYAEQDEEERKARGEWYADAFEMCAERFARFAVLWKNELKHLKKTVLQSAEQKKRKGEKIVITDIEHSIEES